MRSLPANCRKIKGGGEQPSRVQDTLLGTLCGYRGVKLTAHLRVLMGMDTIKLSPRAGS